MTNPLIDARRKAESDSQDPQERNRLWWERLPMTYVDWSEEDRGLRADWDFETTRRKVLSNGPFLRETFDYSRFADTEVLDVGCGAGVMSGLFADAGARVTSIDLTQAAVVTTKHSGERWGFPFRVGRMDAEALALKDDSFDFAFSWGVLHHTRDTETAFAEVARVLKPGGAGLIMVYHKSSAVYYLKGLHGLLLKGKLFEGYNLETVQRFHTDGYYHRHFTRRELSETLTDAGLHVNRTIVTQMQKRILPGVPRLLDRYLKARIGWFVIAEFEKPPVPRDSSEGSQ